MAGNSQEAFESSFGSRNLGSTASPNISLLVEDVVSGASLLDELRASTARDGPAKPCITTSRHFLDDEKYFMDHPKRGIAVIISNQSFDDALNLDERKGAEVDADILDRAFKALGFRVKHYINRTTQQMQDIMKRYASLDHTDSDCFLAAILTHGTKEDHVFGVNKKIKLDELLGPFRGDKCLSLVGKPKIFIIQACRGRKEDRGVDVKRNAVESDGRVESDGGHEDSGVSQWPTEADFLVAHSTAPGYVSWRNRRDGSWYIQKLGRRIDLHYGFYPGDPEKKEGLEFHRLLIKVNSDVVHHCKTFDWEDECAETKQVPSFRSQLTKELRFLVKAPPAPKNAQELPEMNSAA